MKRVVHIVIGIVLVAILVGQGALLIHMAYSQECWEQCMDTLREERGWGALAGIVLLALVIVYLITGIRRKPEGEQYLAFSSNGTTVSILLKAVNEFIGKIGDEFAAIVYLRPSVRPRGRSIDITLDIRVLAGTQIPELCQLLQERVRESVRQNLGLSEIKRIRVQVKDIVGDAPPSEDADEDVIERGT